ncbi:MAG: DUF92 domain-containing protein [Infirmifilum sp.]|uniref:DUF92 domain-containing protein n=1 Tax=Infirmifilum sp. TaxID=2856575 RepID=UPI003D0A6AC0
MSEINGVIFNFAFGLALGLPLGLAAYKLKYLDAKAAALSIMFSGLYFMGGIGLYLASLTFFFSSSLITKLGYANKRQKDAAEREGGRSSSQVIGAGLVAALFTALHGLFIDYRQKLLPTALAVLAASNADTWAAELGAIYPGRPRLITRPWVKVEPGTSGGITPLGTMGSILGAAIIGVVALLESNLGLLNINHACVPLIIALGWLGEVLDSVVGATLQKKYYCPRCKTLTDKTMHSCGEKTLPAGGFSFITNEVTNLIATGLVGLLGFLILC